VNKRRSVESGKAETGHVLSRLWDSPAAVGGCEPRGTSSRNWAGPLRRMEGNRLCWNEAVDHTPVAPPLALGRDA